MFFFIIAILIYCVYRLLFKREDSIYYNGPVPSKDEQNENQKWIANHIEQFPNSTHILQSYFPKARDKAKAVIRYNYLSKLLASGKIDEAYFDAEVDKILPLIDISEDFTK